MTHPKLQCLAAALLLTAPVATHAQTAPDDADAGGITVEFNSAAQRDDACQLTFLIRNQLDTPVASLVLETVLLTKDGAVDRLTLFDMRDLPAATPRVRQFNVPALQCGDLGQVLINGVKDCALEDGASCGNALTYSSRTDVEMLG